MGFQDFKFEHKYDCIWIQWFIMYLTDDDLVKSLKDCSDNLTVDEKTGEKGLIIVKENVKNAGLYVDKEDNSVVRTPVHFNSIFQEAGLEVLHQSLQPGWPKDLYEICMWVLRPKKIN